MLLQKYLGLSPGHYSRPIMSLITIYVVMMFIKKTMANVPKIGIIGGGIGGTAAAYFLQELLCNNVAIDLYEPENIGGRLSISKTLLRDYEMGGSILHPRNYYMNKFVKLFDLKKTGTCDDSLGIFDGDSYAFFESKYELMNWVKYIWRYGLDPYWLRKGNNEMLNSFDNIYKYQSKGEAFKTVSDLLAVMNPKFVPLLQKTFRNYLKEDEGLHDRIIDEVIAAITRANYGQLPDIHAFVGSVSVAGASPNLWSVYEGNKRVPEELLKASGAKRLKKIVSKIKHIDGNNFRVYSNLVGDAAYAPVGEKDFVDYDAVVIASPMTSDTAKLQLVNFTKNFEFPGTYQQIICSIIEGHLNKSTFGNYVSEILTYNPDLFYNSIGRQSPINITKQEECNDAKSNPVYKVFSPEPLTEIQMNEMFESYNNIEFINWLAYPHYTTQNVMMDNFELMPGLYYVNAIEKAASAIEMSAIGAKNVALLIHKYLGSNNCHKEPQGKEEL